MSNTKAPQSAHLVPDQTKAISLAHIAKWPLPRFIKSRGITGTLIFHVYHSTVKVLRHASIWEPWWVALTAIKRLEYN